MISEGLARAREVAITKVSGLSDRREVAVLGHWGIESEQALRALRGSLPELVRAVWGLASRQDIVALIERISALEDAVRDVEDRVEKR